MNRFFNKEVGIVRIYTVYTST